jgi:transposase InsO family protein
MSKHRVAVLKVVSGGMSVTAAAAAYGISRQHLQRLLRRYRDGGLEALEPRSRRPRGSPRWTPDPVRERVVALRTELIARGLDAGPVTIAWHLGREGLRVPSTSTIRRILHAAGLVTPEPRKRPRSSWIRFEAAAPNGVWQSDVTHWRLADGSEVEICSWLDDHSRYLLGCTAFARVSGDDVVATFTAAGEEHGWPAATLTDDGAVYTSRFTGGRNGFEYLLAYLAIRQRNGSPGHPQTQGKVERFHQTLKRWLGRQPAARTLAQLQAQLDAFRLRYDLVDRGGRTGRSDVGRLPRRTGRRPRRCPPAPAQRATSGSATTWSTGAAASPCAGRDACITSASGPPMPVGASSPSSMSTRSASWPSTRARSCPPTTSSP